MTTYRRTVRNPDDLAQVVIHLGNMQQPFVVTTTPGEETRRDRQNRLSWQWYKDISKQLDGWTVEGARAYCKLHVGVPYLMSVEPDFRSAWERLIRDRFTPEEKLDLMLEPHDYPVTRIMSVKQMAEYLNRVQQKMAAQGVTLTDPDARKYEQEFGE